MSSLQRFPLRDLIVDAERTFKPAADTKIWNLNLDQIEPDTGRVLRKHMVAADELGPSTYPFSPGTVLYSKLRPYLNKVVVADDSGVATTELVPLRCNPGKISPQYLAYFLRSPEFLGFANTVVAGAKMPRMVMSEFWNYPIPLPPLPEQHRIAAILDQADALRAKRREALAQLDRLTQSIFIEMFGDPVSNPKNWPISSLAKLSERIQIGPFGSQLHEEDYIEGGVPLVNPTHIKGGMIFPDRSLTVPQTKYEQLSQYHLSVGDLVMGRRGEMGRCAVITNVENGWLCGTGSLFVRPDGSAMNSVFLANVIASQSMRKHLENVAQGVTMPNLNKDIVGALPIPTPPIALQQKFVALLSAITNLRGSHQKAANELDALFASLQHRAFRGEL